MLTETIIITIVLLINLLLSYIIFLKSKNNLSNKFFFCLIISIITWSLSNYLADYFAEVANNENVSTFFTRATFSFVSLLAPCFYAFSVLFPKSKIPRIPVSVYLVFSAGIIMFIVSMTNLVVSDVIISETSILVKNGILIYLFLIYMITVFFASFYVLYHKYISATSLERPQLQYLILGTSLTVMSASFSNLIFPLIFETTRLSKYGPYFTIFLVLCTAYAIIKHNLFNIKVILTEIAVAIIILSLLIQALTTNGTVNKVVSWSVLIVVLYGSYLLIKSILKEIKQREQMERLAEERSRALVDLDERNRNLLTLQKFSNIILDNNELKPMIKNIIDVVPKEVPNCLGTVVALTDNEKNIINAYDMSSVGISSELKELWAQLLKKYRLPLDEKDNLLMQCYHEQAVQKSNNLTDFLCPPFKKGDLVDLRNLSNIKGLFAVPLAAGDDRYGVLIYGFKTPIEKVISGDIGMILMIGNEISLAIQRAMTYENLKKANEYLQELDHMKDEFISVTSHELNTPLAAIQGYLSMILDEGMGKVDVAAREYLERVYSSSKRLAALILDLLNVSRIEQGRIHLIYKETDMKELIDSVIDELIVKAQPKGIYLKFEKPKADLPMTWCDINRIKEVVINLVGNSIKFTAKGGVVIRAEAKGKMIEIQVEDTGVGFKKGEDEKLFKKFSQLNREVNELQGSGLGLYISKNLVDLHGGKIWAESLGEGRGARFAFTLPILEEKPKDPYEGEGEVIRNVPAQNEADKKLAAVAVGRDVPKEMR